GAAYPDLAAASGRDLGLLTVDDHDLDARAGPATGVDDGLDIVGRAGAGHGAGLGEPVPVEDGQGGKVRDDPVHHLDGDVGRPGHRHAQAGEVAPGAFRVVEDFLEQGR